MAMLISLDDYKTAIGETDAANDPRHTLDIEAASAAILNYTDRDFGTSDVTETRTYSIPDQGYIVEIDDASDVAEVDGIGGRVWRPGIEGPSTAYGVYTYIEVAPGSRESLLLGFTRNADRFGDWEFDEIDVTATWGWPTVPDDIQRACVMTASAYGNNAQNLQGGLAAKSVAEVSWNFMQQQAAVSGGPADREALPARAAAICDPYRRLHL